MSLKPKVSRLTGFIGNAGVKKIEIRLIRENADKQLYGAVYFLI
jgi:hypothetical protein